MSNPGTDTDSGACCPGLIEAMASQDQVKVKVGGIPGLAALASLKLGVIFVFVVEDFRIPGLAALASLKRHLRRHRLCRLWGIPGLAALASLKRDAVENVVRS